MSDSRSSGTQRFVPMLGYRDAAAAIPFLCKAFGFEERFRYPMPDGSIGYAELGYGESVVALASADQAFGFVSPKDLPAQHCQIKCIVDDVDAHFGTAREAGATVIAEPQNHYGERMYRAVDIEGHRWIFSTPAAPTSESPPIEA